MVFLPFPTSVIAENPRTAAPLIFYALSTALVGVLLLLLTWVARRPRLMRPGETPGGIIWPLATVVDVFARKLKRRMDGAD